MVEPIKSWVRENSTLVYFLIGQVIVVGGAAASLLAYMVKLETRVHIMETRGAEYSVVRMAKMEEKITVLEQQIRHNEDSIKRVIDQYFKERQK
jgi:hypothetical protein